VARVLLWFLAVVLVLQLAMGGWKRLRSWTAAKFIGVQTVAVAK
jgi:hypothetical protein